jgi:hypothetical protein
MVSVRHVVDLLEWESVVNRLIAEFSGELPPGTVLRALARAREQLLAEGVRSGLAPAAEALARSRLRERVPT